MESQQQVTVGSLFCGIGGFCRAFSEESAHVIWANDSDKFVKITYEENFPHTRFIYEDIRKLHVDSHSLSAVDIMTAGFPCQPFSIAGHRKGFDDHRGNVFFEIVRLLNELERKKPKVLLLENVKNFKQPQYLSVVIDELNRAGYWFDSTFARVLNTYDYTKLPQNRERLFMIALNKDYFDNVPLNFPDVKTKHSKSPYDVFETDKKAEDYYYFKPNSKYWKLFKEKMDLYESHQKRNVYLLRRWYVRPYLNGHTPTLSANMGTGGHNVPVIKDKWGIRKLTVRECARLQGFDDDWFVIPSTISKAQIYKQIGNSVSVPLVQKLAKICIKAIEDLPRSK